MLPCMAWKAGRVVIPVGPRGTSQTCAGRGERVVKALPEGFSVCPAYGYTAHHDVYASQVIPRRARSGPTGASGPPGVVPVGS
ncbi:hypothetical protein QT17_12875 [Thermus sp. 2.9]|nr:hypothetical protein QT17_12875 [Thermus sp. 2.9]